MSDPQQQKQLYQKKLTDFLDAFSSRFNQINNYQTQKGKLGYGTKLNVPNKQNANIFLNM